MNSEYFQITTGYGPLHIHIDYDKKGPTQVFCNIPPLGTEISGLTSALGLVLSKYLNSGGDPKKIIRHLNSIKGDKPFGFGEKRIDSIPHAIATALRDHLIRTEKMERGVINKGLKKEGIKEEFVGHCSKCYSPNIAKEAGCEVCKDCGHSKCG